MVSSEFSTKAWGNQRTKAWGRRDVVDKSGMRKNFGSGRCSKYIWSAPNDPQKLAMPLQHDGGFPSPSVVRPSPKNAWDWSVGAAAAHPKGTSPVADDDKASEHDSEDNELDFLDESDDDLQYDVFDSDMTKMSHEIRKKNSSTALHSRVVQEQLNGLQEQKKVSTTSLAAHRAASTHPKNTSPVADEDKASKHDAEDNELKEHDDDDDKFRDLIFLSKYT
ncbi:hypothetical protein CQW23_24236 [Capsicum baccatum]|uniref:Uncharacterized protein n=1 Tax=Capsicum baccatum TaxID=33114 RepID=A0A2G2VU94_CAPBA|nr:hypothetical protein CQW23_24236 [Capsicum baccatum]